MKKSRISPALIVAVIVNFILFAVKLYIGLRTNSLCIYTDSMNNLADTLSAGIGFLGLFFMAGNATSRFPYGFGRLEHLTGFIMALMMTAAGCSFAYRSLERFFAPVPVWFSTKYAWIIAATCLVKLAMGFFFRTVRKRGNRSPVIRTIELDSFMDSAVTLATLISFSLTNYVHFVLDSVLGLAISIVIAIEGIRLIMASGAQLLGTTDPLLEKQIRRVIEEYGETPSKIWVHSYGRGSRYAQVLLLRISQSDIINGESVCVNIKRRMDEELGLHSTVGWEEHDGDERENEKTKEEKGG